MNEKPLEFGAIPKLIFRVAPFFLSFLLFQAPLFLVVSPVPLFILTLKNRVWVSLGAFLSNLAILSSLNDPKALWVAGFFWLGVGILFPFLIRKTGKIQQSAAVSYLFLVHVVVGALVVLGRNAGQGPIEYVRSEVFQIMDQLILNPQGAVKELVESEGRDGLYRKIMTELPSGILISLLLSFWVNLLFASQLVRGFLSKTFWSRYRNPEWLVWPTIASAALFAFTEKAPYLIGLNGFKLFMVLYGLQGLSILSHFLNRAGIQGFFRTAIYAIALFAGSPVVVSAGFFDLWFDFRKKFGQI
ncbi:MAG: YybS family protein [Bdellovibrionales bacterium]|nr:YybS family protein [Bdellovibrionales bacterium]